MALNKKLFYFALIISLISVTKSLSQSNIKTHDNPFLKSSNVSINYAKVTSKDVEEYAKHTITEVTRMIASIKK